jgi:hypothetical protein
MVCWVGCHSPALPAPGDGGGGDAIPENPNAATHCGMHTTIATCRPDLQCNTYSCPNCAGGEDYVACIDKGGPQPGFACADCTAPADCEKLDAVACAASPSCHRVFYDPGTCGCALAGCCMQFQRCAAGKQAICTPGARVCDAKPPDCGPSYAVAYPPPNQLGCYEGCVLKLDCQ